MASFSAGDMSQQNGSGSSLVVRQPKRRGIALSCAECRRLKLKCSRVFPCNNCVKKGCSAICPDASLTTGKGNRFVLANTQELHEKIAALADRVRQLEDGLGQSHAHNSTQPHPLLSEELLLIKRPLERERPDPSANEDEKHESEEGIDTLGSLSLSTDGRASFFGQAASSWHLLQNEEGSDDEDQSPMMQPQEANGVDSSDIAWLSHTFPFASTVEPAAQNLKESILDSLPAAETAKDLVVSYYRHAAWMYHPIKEPEFETIFVQIYDTGSSSSQARASGYLDSHNLAVLCLVLAMGALVDLTKPKMSAEANKFFQLGRAALSIDSVFEEHSIAAIQALVLMCHYMFIAEMSNGRWVTFGMIVKLAQSVGLHRDIRKWKVDAGQSQQSQQRRDLFYEVFTFDAWQALTFGRPPSFSAAHVDFQMPQDTIKDENGEIEMSFVTWKYRFSAQCLGVVIDKAFGARVPSYKVIQDLDAKVRNWYIPPSLRVPGFGRGPSQSTSTHAGDNEPPSVQLTMQRYIAYAIREMTLFYMHRGFFAQAMEDSPADPMGSKYAPSVLAAYNCATSFVSLIDSLFNQHPQLTERMWFLFTHVFSCAVVLGSIATKSRMGLARSALSHLELAYNLFTRTSDTARRSKVLPILSKLRDRGRNAFANGQLQASQQLADTPGDRSSGSYFTPKIKGEVDELSALGGMTRLVSRRTSSSGSPSASAPSPRSQGSAPSPAPLYNPPSHSNSHGPLATSSTNSSSSTTMEVHQLYLPNPSSSNAATASSLSATDTPSWSAQNYTHIHSFNVNIDMGIGGGGGADSSLDYYANNHTPTAPTNGGSGQSSGYSSTDVGMLYRIPSDQNPSLGSHNHSQSIHPSSSQYHPASSPSTTVSPSHNGMLPLDMSAEPYYANVYGDNISPSGGFGHMYSNGHAPMMSSPSEMQNGALPDNIHDTWQNFMARYQS